jgi:benzodiazapine receptor
MTSLRTLLAFLGITFAAAAVGSAATRGSIGSWYDTLRKPRLNPPRWVFGPVWTILYTAMAVAAWRDWVRGRGTTDGTFALNLFAAQLALNVTWSIVFFGLRSPTLGFRTIRFLWLAIAGWLVASARVERRTVALIAPYLAWVTFAAYLNQRILALNGASSSSP